MFCNIWISTEVVHYGFNTRCVVMAVNEVPKDVYITDNMYYGPCDFME